MNQPTEQTLRRRLYVVIFEHDTHAGKAFDVFLLWAILLSVLAVSLESVNELRERWGLALRGMEWAFTVAFSIEYVLRMYCSPDRGRYARSFFGVVDLVAVLPTYVSLVVPGAQSLLVVRVLRLLRVFRVLKLVHFWGQAESLLDALRASLPKITVFLGAVLSIVVIVGATMYLVEGPAHGFDSIPKSMYWAIVTLTTVGFGDVTPRTPLGQILASALMIVGYGIIAVPTGIVTTELVRGQQAEMTTRACHECSLEGHDTDAKHCKGCGAKL